MSKALNRRWIETNADGNETPKNEFFETRLFLSARWTYDPNDGATQFHSCNHGDKHVAVERFTESLVLATFEDKIHQCNENVDRAEEEIGQQGDFL